jgi:hypothetical protein
MRRGLSGDCAPCVGRCTVGPVRGGQIVRHRGGAWAAVRDRQGTDAITRECRRGSDAAFASAVIQDAPRDRKGIAPYPPRSARIAGMASAQGLRGASVATGG